MAKVGNEIGYHDDQDEFVAVPHRWAICHCCDGEGHTSAHLGDVTEWLRDECTAEERDDYFAGHYDRPCDECDGTGKVMVADYARMTPAQKQAYDLDLKIDADLRAEEEAERRFGC